MIDPTDLAGQLAPLRARPHAAALLFDFDGTLSPVVDDPAAAQALPGVVPLLDELARHYAVVAAVSGRPVGFLAAHLPGSLVLSGLYGLETQVAGAVVDHPDSQRWRPVVADVVERATAQAAPGQPLDGLVVEPKGLSITLHVRTHPHLGPATEALARELASASGLEVRPAKMSFELHPPVEADKGTAVRDLVGGARAALFVGDDVGDVPAFDALADLRAHGGLDAVVLAAVGGPELPDEVRRRADLVLPRQRDVLALLEALRPA